MDTMKYTCCRINYAPILHLCVCCNIENCLSRLLLNLWPDDLGWLLAEKYILQNKCEFVNTLSSLIYRSHQFTGFVGFSPQGGLGQPCPRWASSLKSCLKSQPRGRSLSCRPLRSGWQVALCVPTATFPFIFLHVPSAPKAFFLFFFSLALHCVLNAFLKPSVSWAQGATFEQTPQSSIPQGASFWIWI